MCDDACSNLIEEMKIPLDAPGGRPEFRCVLTASFFLKFYLTVKNKINNIPHELLSVTKPFRKEPTKASQGFQVCNAFLKVTKCTLVFLRMLLVVNQVMML